MITGKIRKHFEFSNHFPNLTGNVKGKGPSNRQNALANFNGYFGNFGT